MLCCI